jgi:hypothetical protein
VNGLGAPEGWPTMAVVATCRPLIGPDRLAGSSLPFLMRGTTGTRRPLRARAIAAALNTNQSSASPTMKSLGAGSSRFAAGRHAHGRAPQRPGWQPRQAHQQTAQGRLLSEANKMTNRSLPTVASNTSRRAPIPVLTSNLERAARFEPQPPDP